nr:PE family protein [Mycobacterium bohemicum]
MESLAATLSAANEATAMPTTAVLPAAGDEVSASIATLFSRYGLAYQELSTQAATFHTQFMQTLTAGAQAYATAEVAGAEPLRTFEADLLALVNAPTETLLGRPLIGNGAEGTTNSQGAGTPGGAGGILWGDGGDGGASTTAGVPGGGGLGCRRPRRHRRYVVGPLGGRRRRRRSGHPHAERGRRRERRPPDGDRLGQRRTAGAGADGQWIHRRPVPGKHGQSGVARYPRPAEPICIRAARGPNHRLLYHLHRGSELRRRGPHEADDDRRHHRGNTQWNARHPERGHPRRGGQHRKSAQFRHQPRAATAGRAESGRALQRAGGPSLRGIRAESRGALRLRVRRSGHR